MDVEAVIAEAVANDTANQAKAAPPEVQQPTEPAKSEPKPDEAESQELASKPDSELTPDQLTKRNANRESHLNSKLAKLRRENRALKAQNGQPTNPAPAQQPTTPQAPAKAQPPVEPKEEDFDGKTWGEYQDALRKFNRDLVTYEVEQRLSERDGKAAKETEGKQFEANIVSRVDAIGKQEAAFAAENPDFNTLYDQNRDFLDNMPIPVAQALMMAENATLAIYTLMKEGKLDDLEDMPPGKILMEIAKAEARGATYLTKNHQNEVTNAPAPLKPGKINATVGKTLNDKSVEELMEQFGKRT